MTNSAILTLQPGRQLDAAVAVALGWTLTEPLNPQYADPATIIRGYPPGETIWQAVPRWSTEHGAALQALEAFTSHRPYSFWSCGHTGEMDGSFRAVITNAGGSEEFRADSGDVPGLSGLAFAACRAILLAGAK